MIIPPLLMRMKLIDRKTHVNLWIPLFLAWLIAGLLALALSPLILLLVLLLWPTGWGKFLWQLGPSLYSVLCELRHLEIDVNGKNQVQLYFR
jgi:hypothetical protein